MIVEQGAARPLANLCTRLCAAHKAQIELQHAQARASVLQGSEAAAAAWFSETFQRLYSGFSFMIPLILMYFLGGAIVLLFVLFIVCL